MHSDPADISIGIDFGTTNTVIALAGPEGEAEALQFTQDGVVHRLQGVAELAPGRDGASTGGVYRGRAVAPTVAAVRSDVRWI